jgi:pimeloyl-ACP methyl ester carboxylesterase
MSMRRALPTQDSPREARDSKVIRLPDGRRLAYAQFGDPAGRPLFLFHGGGDCRLQRHPDDSIAESLGVRLITIDRPGIAASDFKKRKLIDWPDDVAAVADKLEIERFSILGYSMGGPHALACAYLIPRRLVGVGIVSSLGPFEWPGAMDGMSQFNRRLFRYASRSHRIVQIPLLLAGRQAKRDPSAWVDRGRAMSSGPDREVYDRVEGHRENQLETLVELLQGGSRGLAWELKMVTKPWAIDLGSIEVDVHLWYGSEDTTTPPRIGRELASHMPRAHLTVYSGEGHQCIFLHWREILQTLT